MATVRLYGHLERFGRAFRLEVQSAGEALRAIAVQVPGFRQALEKGHYQVRVRKQDITPDGLHRDLDAPLMAADVVHIVPRAAGAKKNGLFNIIVGVVMVVAAFYTGGASIAAWGAMSTGLAVAGAGMILAGAATMMSPVPKGGSSGSTDNGNDNTAFNSLDNRTAQGNPIPLIYGKVMVGSVVVSQELETY